MSVQRFRVISIVALSVLFPLGAIGAPSPKDQKKSDEFLIEINKDGWLQLTDPVTGEIDILESEVRIARFVRDMYDVFKELRGEQGVKQMVVLVRAEKYATFNHIYRWVRSAEDAGFTNIQVRLGRLVDDDKTSVVHLRQAKDKGAPLQIPLRMYAHSEGDEKGNISRLTCKIGKKDEEELKPIQPADAKEMDDKLKKLDSHLYGVVVKLREHQQEKDDLQPEITIQCEPHLRYSEVLKAMETLRGMNFKNIAIMPIPKKSK